MQPLKSIVRSWRKKLSLKKNFSIWRKEWQNWRKFWKSYENYQKLAPIQKKADFKYIYPCIYDATSETRINPTYFYQDSWAFEKIVKRSPKNHVDIGSNHKYVALLSKVVPVTMVDIRPLSLSLDTLKFMKGSILELPFDDNSIESLSCLCVVEHIGLGRYGDPLDPYGSEKAIQELKRVLQVGGHLYISVPVGNETVTAFNAGRVFSIEEIYTLLSPLKIVDQNFIVNKKLQKKFEYIGGFSTTGLFELEKCGD